MDRQSFSGQRSIEELIDVNEPGWAVVQSWLNKATNQVDVLSAGEAARNAALLATQVTTRSPMGAIIYSTGGMFVDHGWLRLLGAGCERCPRSMPSWNFECHTFTAGKMPPLLLVADDVIGGFFAIDGGVLGCAGGLFYFAPDTLLWEPMNMGYSDFVEWTLRGDLAGFYSDYRWGGWQEEVKRLSGDLAIGFFPYLWADAENLACRERRVLPILELYTSELAMARRVHDYDYDNDVL